MMNYTVGRWVSWGVSGLIFAVDTAIVLAAPNVAAHPIHGVVRLLALAAFVFGCCLWTVAPAASRQPTVAIPSPVYRAAVPMRPQGEPGVSPRTNGANGDTSHNVVRLPSADTIQALRSVAKKIINDAAEPER